MPVRKILFIVPARKGSKGIIDKNIILLGGRPLISYVLNTISASLKNLDNFDCRLVVSTNDSKIKSVAKKYNAEVPFIRPESLSQDTSNSIDVIFHALDWLSKNESYNPEIIVLIQPTSPFIIVGDIINALSLFVKKDKPVVSVVKNSHPIEWNYQVKNEKIEPIFESNIRRRQDSIDSYHLNGAIYISNIKDLMKFQSFINRHTCLHNAI